MLSTGGIKLLPNEVVSILVHERKKQKEISNTETKTTGVRFTNINALGFGNLTTWQGRYTIVNSLLNQTPHCKAKLSYRALYRILQEVFCRACRCRKRLHQQTQTRRASAQCYYFP